MNEHDEFHATLRFRVIRKIGAGGAGAVYEAYDREQGARVALKTLWLPSAAALLRFKNEFRSLQDLHHPNLVTLGELFEAEGQWFFSMEFVEGRDLVEWSSADQPLTKSEILGGSRYPRLRRAFAQLFRGLNALHSAGKVHRDIKPKNVLVTLEGRVVILDFGLVVDTANPREHDPSELLGSLHYMAPEQAVRLRVDPRADSYSAGVVLYRALTGRLPFERTAEEMINFGTREKPTPPSRITDGIPSDLNALCMDLLQVTPGLRPSAEEAMARLEASGTSASVLPPAPPFVGRDAELTVLREAFNETLFGGTVAVAVSGNSGVGKSVLVRRFGEQISAESGAVVLSGRCYERESVPYKGIDGVVDALSRWLARLKRTEMRALLPPGAALLWHVFPVLRRIEELADRSTQAEFPVDPRVLRAELFATMRELFVRIGMRLPIVIVIDDLQWSDADSLMLLRELVRPPNAPGLLLLATVRTSADERPEVLRELPATVRHLRLGSLAVPEARALAALLLRRVPWSAEGMVEQIAREASGHPLYIDELVRHALLNEDGGNAGTRLEDALWTRISRLEPVSRRVVELAALAGAPRTQDVLAHAVGLEFGPFARVVASLRAANLVRTSGLRRIDSADVYHDFVRKAVLAHLDEAAQVEGHRRLAEALVERDPTSADALAVHWRGAREPEKSARNALTAASLATDALAFDRAAALYRMVLALGISTEIEARAIRARLGDALANAGRGAEAAAVFLEAVNGASPAEALDLQGRAAEQLLITGHFDEGLETLKAVLAAMGMEVPVSRRAAIASLLIRRGQLLVRGLRFRETTEAACDPDDLRSIDLLGSVSMALGMVDTLRGADFQTRHLLRALDAGEPRRVARALAIEAVYSATGGTKSSERTAQIVTLARAVADRVKVPKAFAWGLGAAGATSFLEGRWADANAYLDQALGIMRKENAGLTWENNSAHFYQLGALLHLGELKELGRRIPILVAEAQQRGDRYATTQFRTGLLSIAWLARGDAEGARREANDAILHWSRRGTHLPHFLDLLAQAQIDLYEGRAESAYARVADRGAALESAMLLRVQFVRIKMLDLRARVAIALARLRVDRADELLREASVSVRAIEQEGARWATPLARLMRAGIASCRGEREKAIALLLHAEAEFTAEGMALHLAATQWRRSELSRGSEGERARQLSRAWMDAQSVHDPKSLVRMLAPA